MLDARTLFSRPPADDAERETWKVKPRLAVVPKAFSSTPIVRFIGRTDEAETVAGWQSWLPIIAGWVGEGRTPLVFVHTPDNVAALGLARQLHAEVRALAPSIAGLPTPAASQHLPSQGSLFD